MTSFEYPFCHKWIITENRLKALKDSTNTERIISGKFTTIVGLKYFFEIEFNDRALRNEKVAVLCLHLDIGTEKMIELKLKVSTSGGGFESYPRFLRSEKQNYYLCSVGELFGSSERLLLGGGPMLRNKYIIDGEFTLKIKGNFKIKKSDSENEMEFFQTKMEQRFRDIWNMGYTDFSIVIEGKVLEVHKVILACQSPIFVAMFKPHTKEAIENKVEIPGFLFSYSVVEKAVKLCYDFDLVSDISTGEGIEIYRFCEMYDIQLVRDYIELYLMKKLDETNFSETVNGAVSLNAMKLKDKCTWFFIDCISKKIILPNIENVDKDFVAEIYKNLYLSETY
uniref:BTB domain-containing protein n=1 Tax=Panagrolaimus davidi TaxID=227884 RepID=A0A914PDC6_9BILA